MTSRKKQKLESEDAVPSQDDNRQVGIIIQFRDAQEEAVGPQVHLSLNTTKQQLQLLLNQLKENEEVLPYSLKLRSPRNETVEVLENLATALSELKGVTSETSLDVTFFPLATFRVRPVTRCTASLEGHSEAVLCVAFSPDSTTLASGSGDTNVRIWDLDTETPSKTLKGHQNWVMSVCWSPTSDILASGGMDRSIRIWNIHNSSHLGQKEIILKGHSKGVTSLAWQPLHLIDESQKLPNLASAALDMTIRIWDVIRAVTLITLSSHTLPVTQIKWSGNLNTTCLYSCSRDTTVKIWDTKTGNLINDLKSHGHWVNTLVVNTEWITQSGHYDHTVASRQKSSDMINKCRNKYLNYLNNSCGGKERIVTGSDDCTMFLWEPLNSKKPIARLTGHQKPVNHVQFSPDGRYLASASFDKSIRLWDAVTGKYLAVFRGHVGPVYRIAWCPDSRCLASASSDSTVKIWDMQAKRLKEDLPGHADEVYAIDWSIDGARVATGSKDKNVKIWRH